MTPARARGMVDLLRVRDHRLEQGELLIAQGLSGAEIADEGPALSAVHMAHSQEVLLPS